MARSELPSVTLWACECCTLVLANGECCDSDEHGGRDGKEPLSAIPEGLHTTLGMFWHEHSEDCPNYQPEDVTEYRGWIAECDCERQEFSWSSCDACGSSLGGERHAFVIWYPKTEGNNNG